jgi:hypothetical protein
MSHMQAQTGNDEALRASRRKSDHEERARQIKQRIAEEEARYKALGDKTLRLRELRLAREASEHETYAAAKAGAPSKKRR